MDEQTFEHFDRTASAAKWLVAGVRADQWAAGVRRRRGRGVPGGDAGDADDPAGRGAAVPARV
jgi:hypothetical protein